MQLAPVEALQEASGLPPLVTLLPTEPAALVALPQRVSEPQLPVRPQLADLPAPEARVPSEGAPGDITDPALAPPATAVPPAWDHAAEQVPAAEAVGADERASASFCRLASSERLEGGS